MDISYLGSLTYAHHQIRNQRLIRDKFFSCSCSRCQSDRSQGDPAAAVPCPNCHKRVGRYLDEDVQYDDGENGFKVHYCKPRRKKDGNEDVYDCPNCGDVDITDGLKKAMDTGIQRSMDHLEEGLQGSLRANGFEMDGIDDDGGGRAEREVLLDMTERLACLSGSVLGAKHWTSNLLTFVMLGRKLSSLHAVMLCRSTAEKGGDSNDDNESDDISAEVAECIDSLEKLYSYVDLLKLKSHPGHLLGNLTIGVARVLVAFGDVKSMKFGSEWSSKVDEDYFRLGFEGKGMVKVVEMLVDAWKRKSKDVGKESGDEDGRHMKKRKI